MTGLSPDDLLLAIETGGTKIVCRLVRRDGRVVSAFRLPTTTPDAFIDGVAGAVEAAAAGERLSAIGVASFGPVDLDPGSATFGQILDSTKAAWRGFGLAGALRDRFGAPVAIDTDVNAAALAEQALGAGRGVRAVAYLTVGTGIGGGLAIDGVTLRGGLHPEIGHLSLRRAEVDAQASQCAFHADCAEGLAAGPAIQARLAGRALAEAPEVEALLAEYVGQLAAAVVLAWAPQRIVLGGGVMADGRLAPRVEASLLRALNGYGVARLIGPGGYVVPAELEHAGLEGAMLMARAPGVSGRR